MRDGGRIVIAWERLSERTRALAEALGLDIFF